MILVYITNPDKQTALKIGKHLLQKRLCACANIFKIDSLYWWKGTIEESPEYVLIVKTIEENYEKIAKEVKNIHPYTIPCIIKFKVDEVNKDYLNWLLKEIKS